MSNPITAASISEFDNKTEAAKRRISQAGQIYGIPLPMPSLNLNSNSNPTSRKSSRPIKKMKKIKMLNTITQDKPSKVQTGAN